MVKNNSNKNMNIFGKYSDEIYKIVSNKKNIDQYIIKFHLIILALSMIYGAVIGTFNGFSQVLINTIKIPIILFGIIYISLPVLYVFNIFVKRKLEFKQALIVLLIGFLLTTLVMAAFAPVILLFSLTTSNINFIILLNLAIGGLALLCGLFNIYLIFRSTYKRNYEYASLLIFYFITIFSIPQLIWALRPYFHQVPGFIEPIKSNFYIETFKIAIQEPVLAGVLIFIFSLLAIIILYNLIENHQNNGSSKSKITPENRTSEPGIIFNSINSNPRPTQTITPTKPQPDQQQVPYYPNYYNYPYWNYYQHYYQSQYQNQYR